MPVPVDKPIEDAAEDTLGRGPQAASFVRQVLSLDASDGVVIGVMGPWGSGKTSFVNLARQELEKSGCSVLTFNPWMFSGTDQLVASFFVELSAQIQVRLKLKEIGELLERLGQVSSGPLFKTSRLAGVLVQWKKRGKRPIDEHREALRGKLEGLEKPIAVLLDDLDRLSRPEIREMFKLLRLTANFPNIVYIAAFDRLVVEEALQDGGLGGRDYLEKIVQVPVELPAVPERVLVSRLASALDAALEGIESRGPFDEQAWPDILMEIVHPLVRTPRDVARLAAAAHGSVLALDGEVALTDVLALEAVRVFLPEVFSRIHGTIGALTGAGDEYSLMDASREQRFRSQIEDLVKSAENQHQPVVRALVDRIFSAAARHVGGMTYGPESRDSWMSDRRVAHEDVLRLYLERTLGRGMRSQQAAERAFRHMDDPDRFQGVLESLDSDLRIDVIGALAGFEDGMAAEHVVPGVTALLNFVPEIDGAGHGFLELDATAVVGRVTFRLLRKLDDPVAVERCVREILPRLNALSGKMRLIAQIGHNDGIGHKLVSEGAARQLEREWVEEVKSASAEELIDDPALLRVVLQAKSPWADEAVSVDLADRPDLTYTLLKSARSQSKSQTIGSRFVRSENTLAWDLLAEAYGNQSILEERVQALLQEPPDHADEELLELARKYLNGWRPARRGSRH